MQEQEKLDLLNEVKNEKEQEYIDKIRYTWYSGAFFDISGVSCNTFNIQIKDNIRKLTIIIDRAGKMDQLVFENEIEKPNLFWKNINKIIYKNIEIKYSKNVFMEDKFIIKGNNKKLLSGSDSGKKRDKDLNKFLKLIDVQSAKAKIEELIKKYELIK
ncbi:MAG: hypothetical protein RR594_03235 [Clostridia bacterium]